MKTSPNISNIIKARVAAKAEMSQPKKDGTNPHFKSRYVTHGNLIASIEPALVRHGLDMATELLNNEAGEVGCQISLYHVSGEYMRTEPFFLPAQKTAQGFGSASTYVLRYAIAAFWSIAACEDDDGNEAEKNPTVNPERYTKRNEMIEKIKKLCKEKDISQENLSRAMYKNFQTSTMSKLNDRQLSDLLGKVNDKQ